MSKLQITKELGSYQVITKLGIILTDVSSERQRNNGTIMLQYKNGNKITYFGSYFTGYCRILNVFPRSMRIYQINKVVKKMKNYYFQGKTYPRECNKRVLIPDTLDRLEYISDFVDRQYNRDVAKQNRRMRELYY